MVRSVTDLLAHARTLSSEGRHREAEAAFREIIERDSACVAAHFGLGVAVADQGRFNDAFPLLKTAYDLKPNADAAYALGFVCFHLDELDEARRYLEQAGRLAPARKHALLDLARVLETKHNLSEAEKTAALFLDAHPNSPDGRQVMARVLRRQGDPVAGLDFVASDPTALSENLVVHSAYFTERGRCLDALQRYDDAFVAYAQAQDKVRSSVSNLDVQKRAAIEDILKEREKLKLIQKHPTRLNVPHFGKAPVFLVGFPRSGTTLVETILDAFDGVSVVSEGSIISTLHRALIAKEGPAASLGMDDQHFAEGLRSKYWTAAEAAVAGPIAATLVDKEPLNMIYARVINVLFPGSKFLFVMRHPLDVCVSNFFQSYEINKYMAHFTTLEDTANLYTLAQSVWRDAVSVLGLNVHVVRYESLVEDFETEVRSLLDFIDLEWSDSLRSFHRHARARNITTPSYEQVTQEVYTTSRDRWKNYVSHLTPLKKQLAPFVEAFGYDDDATSTE